MSIWRDIKGFLRQLRRKPSRRPQAPSSLARTLRESTHVRGAYGGMARAGTEAQHDIVAEGHEHYAESFQNETEQRQRKSKG